MQIPCRPALSPPPHRWHMRGLASPRLALSASSLFARKSWNTRIYAWFREAKRSEATPNIGFSRSRHRKDCPTCERCQLTAGIAAVYCLSNCVGERFRPLLLTFLDPVMGIFTLGQLGVGDYSLCGCDGFERPPRLCGGNHRNGHSVYTCWSVDPSWRCEYESKERLEITVFLFSRIPKYVYRRRASECFMGGCSGNTRICSTSQAWGRLMSSGEN
ncbi:hypothetical protein V8C35DRAFT_301547, partial [Trichoderma chlorosporum]